MKQKQLLLIDAVQWAPVYAESDPLRNVDGWFRTALGPLENANLKSISMEADLQGVFQSPLDGVIISGSPRCAHENNPDTDRLLAFLDTCLRERIPVLGVCYGHQILARFLKGTVTQHPEGLQLLNADIQLTESGKQSPLFRGMPPEFVAISGHVDYVAEVPPQCELLASGARTKVQSFQYQDLFYAVQFHPEFTGDIIQFLWRPRVPDWKDKVPFDLHQRIESLTDPDPTTLILNNFVDHVVC